jgi:hypothetical protein
MSHNDKPPNFALKGMADAEYCVPAIAMSGEVSRSPRIAQKCSKSQNSWGESSAPFKVDYMTLSQCPVSLPQRRVLYMLQSRSLRIGVELKIHSDSFLDGLMFFQAERFYSFLFAECS